jgi:inward rectifier potassium channel
MSFLRRERDVVVDTSVERRLAEQERIQSRPLVARKIPGRRQRGAATGIRRIGLRQRWSDDFYHRALTLSWWQFLGGAAVIYLVVNSIFALAYLAQPGAVENARPGDFLDAFFFSVETFGTIGYGVLSPATRYANTVMTVETLTGILYVALTTGLIFARVSVPRARVLFSRVMVVARHDGVPVLMVRMGNERQSQIVQAEVSMTLVRNERTREGTFMRRFHDLTLERSLTPVFAMSFLVMHRLDETSPLHGATAASLAGSASEILVTVTGLDERMAQTVHARASYLPNEVQFGHRYVDIFGFTEEGEWAVDYRRFHDAVPEEPTELVEIAEALRLGDEAAVRG